jgi:hypothetical protein
MVTYAQGGMVVGGQGAQQRVRTGVSWVGSGLSRCLGWRQSSFEPEVGEDYQGQVDDERSAADGGGEQAKQERGRDTCGDP